METVTQMVEAWRYEALKITVLLFCLSMFVAMMLGYWMGYRQAYYDEHRRKNEANK